MLSPLKIGEFGDEPELATNVYDLDGKPLVLTSKQVEALIKRIGILTGGISGWAGVKVEPGAGWMADVGDDKRLVYDLGLVAALLRVQNGDKAVTGVIAHEIGHLRETEVVKYPRGVANKKLAHHMLNLVEDRRIEILMGRVFPGMIGPIQSLRKAMETDQVQRAMKTAPPHHQLLNAIYGVLFDFPVEPTDPEALEAIRRYEPMLRSMIAEWESMPHDFDDPDYITTNDVMVQLVESGLYGDLERLLGKPREEAQPEPEGGSGDDDDEGDDEGQSAPSDASDDGDDADDDGAPGQGGDDDGDDDDAYDPFGGGAPDFDTPGDVDSDGDENAGGDSAGTSDDDDDADDTGATGTGAGGESDTDADGDTTGDGEPTLGDLAAMPQDQRDRLRDAMEDALADDSLTDDERAEAEATLEAIKEAEAKVEKINDGIGDLLDQLTTGVDDQELSENWSEYDRLREGTGDVAATLATRFKSILRENARDRLSAIGYDNGPRIHQRNLPFAGTGRRDLFTQRNRTRNRKYAVSIICDVSVSMRQHNRIENAIRATALAAEALDQVPGVEFSVYMFGARTAVLKPLHLGLAERRGFLGALATGMRIMGGSTALVPALGRAANELLRRTAGSPEVEHLIIVMTDGQPNSGPDAVKTLVTRLQDGKGVDGRAHTARIQCVGIGIQTDAVKDCFTEWSQIDRPSDLPVALTQVLRRKIRKAFI